MMKLVRILKDSYVGTDLKAGEYRTIFDGQDVGHGLMVNMLSSMTCAGLEHDSKCGSLFMSYNQVEGITWEDLNKILPIGSLVRYNGEIVKVLNYFVSSEAGNPFKVQVRNVEADFCMYVLAHKLFNEANKDFTGLDVKSLYPTHIIKSSPVDLNEFTKLPSETRGELVDKLDEIDNYLDSIAQMEDDLMEIDEEIKALKDERHVIQDDIEEAKHHIMTILNDTNN